MNDITRLPATEREGARGNLRPDAKIVPRVADDGQFPFRAGRRVDTHDRRLRHGEEAEGVVVAQVTLGRERQVSEIIHGLHIVRRDAVRGEPLAIERHPLGDVRHLLA